MANSGKDLEREFEEFEQAEASLDSGLESPPRPRGQEGRSVPAWIKWVVLADLLIFAVVVVVVLAA